MNNFIPLIFIFLTFITVGCDGDGVFGASSNPPKISLVIINEDELLDKNLGDQVNLELALEATYLPPMMSIEFEVLFDSAYFSPDIVCSGLGISGDNIVYPYENKDDCESHGNCFNDLGDKIGSTDMLEQDCNNNWQPFVWSSFNYKISDSFFYQSIDNYIDCGQDGLCPGDDGYSGQDFGELDGVWNCFSWNANQTECLSGENVNDDEDGDGIFDPPVIHPTGLIMVGDNSSNVISLTTSEIT